MICSYHSEDVKILFLQQSVKQLSKIKIGNAYPFVKKDPKIKSMFSDMI